MDRNINGIELSSGLSDPAVQLKSELTAYRRRKIVLSALGAALAIAVAGIGIGLSVSDPPTRQVKVVMASASSSASSSFLQASEEPFDSLVAAQKQAEAEAYLADAARRQKMLDAQQDLAIQKMYHKEQFVKAAVEKRHLENELLKEQIAGCVGPKYP